MALIYTYEDAFLTSRCTEEREARAAADVAVYGTFPAAWTERLVKTQTYIIACREHQAKEDDLFSLKLKTYSESFGVLLTQAKIAAAAAAETPTSIGFFSVPLERA